MPCRLLLLSNLIKLVNTLIWILGLGITYCILWAVGGIAISKTGSSGTEQIQKIVFSNYLSKDYDFYNSTFLGSLGTQAIALKDALIRYNQLILNLGLKLAIAIISSILIIAYRSIPLALLTLITMLVILSFTLLSGKWRLKYRRKLSEINSEVAGIVGDIFGHAVTIKSFAKESYEMSRVAKPIKSPSILQDKAWLTSIPDDIGRILLVTVTTMLLLIPTSRLYQNDSISIAVVILIQFYVIKLINSTQAVAEVIKEYESIMASAHQSIVTF